MAKPIIQANNLSKAYRLGSLGAKTFADDIRSFWNKITGKEAPLDPKVIEQINITEGATDSTQRKKNEFWALRNLNFEIKPGEVVGIIGHNGAGKSTLLKVLSRITEPTTGRITLRGRVSSLLEVGTGFHPDLTGRENTYLNGAIHGMTRKEIDAKFDQIVEFAKIEKFIDTPVKRYSSGMYVRLAFAVAAHLEPEILIVDEVLAVGDAAFQSRCLKKMNDISKQGRTVIFVSHIMTSVKALCSRCYLLDHGQITAEGATLEIINQYLTRGHTIGNSDAIEPDIFSCDTGEARFSSILLSDTSGTPKADFFYRDPIHLTLCFTVFEALDELIFSVYFCSMDGNPISLGCSVDIPNQSFPVQPGKYSVLIKAKPNLLPGKYFTKAVMLHPNGDSICAIERVCDFNVQRFAQDDRVSYQWTRSNALTMMATEWELTSL